MKTPSPTTNLMVPMHLDALAVGKDDGPHWSLQAPDFFGGMQDQFEFLGYQQRPPRWGIGKNPYAPGVHLRWALPDALTHGQQRGDDFLPLGHQVEGKTHPRFPVVPNRWVILRLSSDAAQQPSVRAWMVESDFIKEPSEDSPDPTACQWPVFPLTTAEAPGDFKFLRLVGRQMDLEAWPSTDPAHYLSDIRARLTAVGYGDANFAASYPSSGKVFGFHDDMGGLAGPPACVAYLVAGWYFEPEDDPLFGYTDAERWCDRMTELAWVWGDPMVLDPEVPDPTPTRTITHGFVTGVEWKGADHVYDYGPGVSRQPSVAAGNTTLEALAALVANEASPNDPAPLEDLLAAFQNDLLSVYDQDGGDSSTIRRELDDLLHAATFARGHGGNFYEIQRKDADTPADREPTGNVAPAVPLPPPVASSLGDLNATQRALETAAATLLAHQGDYFRLWHKKTDAADGSPVDNDPVLVDLATKIEHQKTVVDGLRTDLLTHRTEASQALAVNLPAYELSTRTRGRYWQASDFALLVTNLGRTSRHGEDHRYDASGKLRCRVSGTTLTGLEFTPTQGGLPAKITTTGIVSVPPPAGAGESGGFTGDVLPDVDALLAEALLLDTGQATFLAKCVTDSSATTEELTEQIRQRQAIGWNAPDPDPRAPTQAGFQGRAPSPAAVTDWLDSDRGVGNPWIPFLMLWELDFHPSYKADRGIPKALERWTFDGADYKLNPGSNAPAQTYEGSTVLTPSAVWNLGRRLREYNDLHPDSPDHPLIDKLIAQLGDIDVLSQVASGVNLSLPQLDQSLQLPPIGPSGGLAVAGHRTVVDLIDGNYETAPWPTQQLASDLYFPLRAGLVQLKRIRIIDAFGRFFDVPQACLESATIGSRLKNVVADQPPIELRPRLAQHARLAFDLISAASDRVQTGADPATTPVCGWITPSYLDHSLLLSDADGALLGKLRLAAEGDEVLWMPDPVAGTAPSDPAKPIANAHLAALQRALLEVPRPDFQKLVEYIEQVEEKIYPPGSRVNTPVSALMGQPIAVARVALTLELDGPPVRDQSLDTFKDWGYSEIAFPVALGDLGRTDDGLFGFFAPASEAPCETDYTVLYAADGTDVSSHASGYLKPQGKNGHWPIRLAAYDSGQPSAPTYATVLVDPRAKIKAQSGILPAKTVELPPQDTAAVLGSHEIFFQVAPVLSGAAKVTGSGSLEKLGTGPGFEMPHPSKKYGNWSWLDLEPGADGTVTWRESEKMGQKTGADGQPLYPATLREGWLRLRTPAAASAAILYFSVQGGLHQVTAGTTVRLTWATKLPNDKAGVQLVIDENTPESDPQRLLTLETVPNQSPGYEHRVDTTTTFTLRLIDGRGFPIAPPEPQKLTIRVEST